MFINVYAEAEMSSKAKRGISTDLVFFVCLRCFGVCVSVCVSVCTENFKLNDPFIEYNHQFIRYMFIIKIHHSSKCILSTIFFLIPSFLSTFFIDLFKLTIFLCKLEIN